MVYNKTIKSQKSAIRKVQKIPKGSKDSKDSPNFPRLVPAVSFSLGPKLHAIEDKQEQKSLDSPNANLERELPSQSVQVVAPAHPQLKREMRYFVLPRRKQKQSVNPPPQNEKSTSCCNIFSMLRRK